MFDTKRSVLNIHKLTNLGPNKLYIKLEELLDGKYLYRTIDGRVLDFKNGIEHKAVLKKISIEPSYYAVKPKISPKVQVTHYPSSHVNRNLDKRKKT